MHASIIQCKTWTVHYPHNFLNLPRWEVKESENVCRITFAWINLLLWCVRSFVRVVELVDSCPNNVYQSSFSLLPQLRLFFVYFPFDCCQTTDLHTIFQEGNSFFFFSPLYLTVFISILPHRRDSRAYVCWTIKLNSNDYKEILSERRFKWTVWYESKAYVHTVFRVFVTPKTVRILYLHPAGSCVSLTWWSTILLVVKIVFKYYRYRFHHSPKYLHFSSLPSHSSSVFYPLWRLRSTFGDTI